MFDLSQPWQTCRFASFDLETTGIDTSNDRIIEIGLVVFDNGEIVDRWQQLVDPERELPPEVVEVTNIQPEDLVGQPKLHEIADELVRRVGNDILLAYNHEFDLGILRSELARIDRTMELPPCMDPFPFCWEHLRDTGLTKNAQLATVSEYLGIPLDAAHRADYDAEAAARVMLELANHVVLPDSIDDLLSIQRALMQKVNEQFARFRRGRSSGRSVLSSGDVELELGAAWLYGDEADPVRFLFSRIPDVRDM